MNGEPNRNQPPPINVAHHIRGRYCQNRPLYRRSRQLTAVRAYSVASESRHLLVFGVPQIDLLRELRQEFARFGPIEYIHNITECWLQKYGCDSDDLKPEPFTDVFHVCLGKLEKARQAKKVLDARNFYGGILHISYAPERESIAEVRAKLAQRKSEVRYRLKLSRHHQKEQQHQHQQQQLHTPKHSKPPIHPDSAGVLVPGKDSQRVKQTLPKANNKSV